MSLIYSHSYEDPDTGQIMDVMIPEDDDDDDDIVEYRNARVRVRDHRSQTSSGHPRSRPPASHPPAPRPRPRPQPRPQPSNPSPSAGRPYSDHNSGGAGNEIVSVSRGHASGGGYDAGGGYAPGGGYVSNSDYFSISKNALVEFIPAVGKVWASFLGVPDKPEATGDHVTDRNNAAEHREALAKHSQNQTRILALSDLAAKAIHLFTH
ncbi:MAG: hypothetical protein MJE77_29410 [Proteobacteria bacterium]|nr:hypothetical protein [Pseudomonadota bacterium]